VRRASLRLLPFTHCGCAAPIARVCWRQLIVLGSIELARGRGDRAAGIAREESVAAAVAKRAKAHCCIVKNVELNADGDLV
jgi:hypothetical protein